MFCYDVVGETKRFSFWGWERSGGEKSWWPSFCVLCAWKHLDKIPLLAFIKKIAFLHLRLPILLPSQRPLSLRAVTETLYNPYKLCYHIHLSYYFEAFFPQGFGPYSYTIQNMLTVHICVPFSHIKAKYPLPPTKQNRQQEVNFSCASFSKTTKQGGVSSAVYHMEKETPSPCSSCQVAMHPGITHFPLFAPWI